MLAGPFHEGEQRLQALTGVRERMAEVGPRVIRDHMPDQHREFFGLLPFIVVGGLDEHDHPWASLMAGPAGFMHSPHPRTLRVDGALLPGDPLSATWRAGAPVGWLGIQPHTRRRNRMNGTLAEVDDAGVTVAVRQSFGNCPKYIHPREAVWATDGSDPVQSMAATEVRPETAWLSDHALGIIERADTLFIASASPHARDDQGAPSEGVDVSHRGGPAGFVHAKTEDGQGTCLTLPDYTGNFMFNTLGNIVLNPKVGLIFIDVDSGALLWLQGLAEVEHDSPEQSEHVGAQRLVRIRITRGLLHPRGWPLAWLKAG